MMPSPPPPSFTPGSFEAPISKRARGGSISGRLRSASDLCDDGFISAHQKGVLKDLIITGDVSIENAFHKAEHGDSAELRHLLQSGHFERRAGSIDMLGDDLDLAFLSVGEPPHDGGRDPSLFQFDDLPMDSPPDAVALHALPLPFSAPTTGYTYKSRAESFGSDFMAPLKSDFGRHAPGIMHFADEAMPEHMSFHPDVHFVGDSLHTPPMPHLGTSPLPGDSRDILMTGEPAPGLTAGRPFGASSARPPTAAAPGGMRSRPQAIPQSSDTTRLTGGVSAPSRAARSVSAPIGIPGSKAPASRPGADRKPAEIVSESADAAKKYIGAYSPEARKKLLAKYMEKRKRRVWTKRVKYDVRKNFADSRLRVKGRFVKKEDEVLLRELVHMT